MDALGCDTAADLSSTFSVRHCGHGQTIGLQSPRDESVATDIGFFCESRSGGASVSAESMTDVTASVSSPPEECEVSAYNRIS